MTSGPYPYVVLAHATQKVEACHTASAGIGATAARLPDSRVYNKDHHPIRYDAECHMPSTIVTYQEPFVPRLGTMWDGWQSLFGLCVRYSMTVALYKPLFACVGTNLSQSSTQEHSKILHSSTIQDGRRPCASYTNIDIFATTKLIASSIAYPQASRSLTCQLARNLLGKCCLWRNQQCVEHVGRQPASSRNPCWLLKCLREEHTEERERRLGVEMSITNRREASDGKEKAGHIEHVDTFDSKYRPPSV